MLEKFLEAERAQLPSWFVVGFGCGIAAWFAFNSSLEWRAFLSLAAALWVIGFALGRGRTGRAIGWFAFAAMLGCAFIWARALWISEPRLERPVIADLAGRVESVDHLIARAKVRLLVKPDDAHLPSLVRISVGEEQFPTNIAPGSQIRVRARLTPPPPMALPGTHDFARDAWFQGIGAVGKAMGPIAVVHPDVPRGVDRAREAMRGEIAARLPERPAGIAIALATGDQHSVNKDDAEAMRRAGLVYLIVVSGLHVAVIVGAAMFLTLKLLALSETLALRFNLVLAAAGAGAFAGIGYTFLTGMQIPTMRSCIAALLVLAGMALGRDAISLRLLAAAALVLLIVWPETLAGASFQLSFAAVAAIIALHSTRWARRLFMRRDEGPFARLGRAVLSMLMTSLAVEIALVPLSLYHFHRAGLYGIGASLIALPLTTFVIMPLEGVALLLDVLGLGAPAWYLCGTAIDLLLWIAHEVGGASGAVALLPSMPLWAFGAMVAGGIWLCLWNSRVRLWGLIPAAAGALGAASAPSPDLLITGDGRHLAVVEDGVPLLLRDRAGDYVRSLLAEASGFDGDPENLDDQPSSDCTDDACVARLRKGETEWRLLATRSTMRIKWSDMTRACASADIVVSDRRLPRGCEPRWLKLDRPALSRTGGLAIYLGGKPRVNSVAERIGEHPWADVDR